MTSTRTDLSTEEGDHQNRDESHSPISMASTGISFEEIGHDDIEDINKSEAGKKSPTISSLASSSSKDVSIIEDASETEVSGDDEESSTAANRNLRKQSEMQLEEEPVVAPEQPPLPDSPAYTPRGLNDSLSPTDAVPLRTNHPFQYSDPELKAEPALIENLEIAAPSPPQRATVESDFSEEDADDERNNSREESPVLEERPETPVRDQREEERNHGGEASNLQVPNEEFFNFEEIIRDLREELETTRTEFDLQQDSQVDELNSLKEEIKRLMKQNTKLGDENEEIS
ncbi:Oidioi.mRNA.OKI2018_I69.XSR.g13712.t1.cds [Oikopleura dioica]|uniref:Oidioi.mRNA.OKI2018_I69.XSR.g13712.t1.cds n=1 Tax=Oikopleura dioica TaxID=34765 RepID=A0ABN7S7P3_OIKDI|nr:Oidioi.mRNA.OKI2018_I69.XSR.g13712.t1.cds [Oikopleura dioica]